MEMSETDKKIRDKLVEKYNRSKKGSERRKEIYDELMALESKYLPVEEPRYQRRAGDPWVPEGETLQ